MTVSDYHWIRTSKRSHLVLLEVMGMPRTAAEARRLLDYKKGNKLDATFRELQQHGLVRSLADGLWGLSPSGQKLRRQLLQELGRKNGYQEPSLDWRLYVWALRGTRRKNILIVLQATPETMPRLLRLARVSHFKAKMTREKAYAVMDELVGKKLAKVRKEKPRYKFTLTEKGLKIREQILAASRTDKLSPDERLSPESNNHAEWTTKSF